MKFWNTVARTILTHRVATIIIIAVVTGLLASQFKKVQFSYTEANLLPEDNSVNIEYDKFLNIFGEEGNIIVLAVKDSTLFTDVNKFNNWIALADKISAYKEVIEGVVSFSNIKELKKNVEAQKFELTSIFTKKKYNQQEVDSISQHIFNDLPFYDHLLFNKETGTIQTIVYVDKQIVNTKVRSDFIKETFNPLIQKFNKENNLQVRVSGMPYVRSMNAASVKSEMGMFVLLGLGVTGLIFFLFFRSLRATAITLTVVIIGVLWSFGFIGLLGYQISILTALIPPLIIVIGVPNAIFLIHKYQQEIHKHGNKAKSLQRVITKVGNATLMTNLTTSAGFATFIFTKSTILKEFGVIASINIMGIFLISLCLIPILYSFMPLPKPKHLKHLEKRWVDTIVKGMTSIVRNKKPYVYIVSFILLTVAIIGAFQIKVSGSLIEDMSKKTQFYKDIVFFEKEFGGILPLEILVDTKKDKGVMNLATLKRIDKLESEILKIPEFSKPISVNNLVKFTKQAFYNGNPDFYKLPTSQEKNFILSYAQNSGGNTNALANMVDKTGRYARITTFMKDIGTERMEQIQEELQVIIDKNFPKERYDVTMTGKALVFVKGTNYLIHNLIISLGLAIVLIALFIGGLFKNSKMILISLIPNVFPLVLTAGLMGYLGIPLKPSTILVFSIAFGISVDDTIHFLAKYRQELIASKGKVRKSVYKAIKESGISMFYTSIVLFFGFLVFVISSFGGTKALGGLVSITLLFAMISNLVILPSLLLTFERVINKKRKKSKK
ncbi:efflux RND transporter permease subunit [Wenyingzhuangia sp. chi5]|uniref:Efflux RND transporter permease subunit n=1 Tax=Wenyingzhuangia gilva TaxID=3057677 RepID=A0ABT8VUI2_9FLAO|nr:efflux RND transporter permease subunit [Wenyingzhuangia sp. chi5]MDO3695611.1 efflux RND transporter permease subunit [Wenyingzhuangia sp. chi5]